MAIHHHAGVSPATETEYEFAIKMDTKDTAAEADRAIDHIDRLGEQPASNPLPWWKQTELRKLYGMTVFLFLASTTLGYDGSLLNGMQTMESWRNCTSLLKHS